MAGEQKHELVRAIGRWGLTALVLNMIIASGIFGLPSVIAGLLGNRSPWAYVAAALGMGAIMACFAEVASQFREAGGPYLYARETFGRFVGIQVGWLAWLVRLTSAAANSNLFVIYLGEFWPRAGQPLPRLMILSLLLGFLAAVNFRGVSAGAQLSSFFAVAKLVPLTLFIVVGMFFLHPPAISMAKTPGAGDWMEAVLLLVFAFGGFEGALMPMSEVKNPRRDAPFALFTALAVTTIVYISVQVIVLGVLPNPAQEQRPLAAAAREFLGPAGAILIALGALTSVYGHLSSQMLNSPRLTFALAEGGDFPPFFAAVHPRFRTPYLSILIYALLLWGLAVAGSFRWNATLSAVARLGTYAAVCGALPVLRRRQPEGDAFRLRGGPLFALVGVAFCGVMISRMRLTELAILAATGALAFANWAWVQRVWRVRPPTT